MADFYFCKHLTTIPDKNIYVSDLPTEENSNSLDEKAR